MIGVSGLSRKDELKEVTVDWADPWNIWVQNCKGCFSLAQRYVENDLLMRRRITAHHEYQHDVELKEVKS